MSAKKKRMGSHRRSNQSKMDTDSLRIEGGASAAELMQTEKSEADLQASPDYSQSETQHSPPSEMTGHRRKLGSSRSKKGRQHVKDSIIESDHKPTEEDAKNNETLEIKMSVETPRHRNLNDQSERDGDGSLFSMPLPNVMDVLISKSENQQEAPNERQTDFGLLSDLCKLEEAKLEGIDESLTQESGDVTSESAHYVDISTFHTSPATSQSTVMEMTDNASSVYSLTEKQNRERDDEDLVRQDEQSELINLSQVDETKQSDDDLTEREAEAAQMQDVQHILVSSESVTNENTSDTSVKLTDQLERHWVNRDEDHLEDDIKPTAERTVHHDMKDLLSENSGNESYLQTLYTEMNAPLASQHQDILEKPTDTDFHPIVSRRKLGSSRRNKGRHHVKDSAAESQNQNEEGVKEKIDDETGGATEITSSVEVVMQEKTAETVVEGMDTSEVITDEVKDDAPLVDISEFIQLNVQEETGTAKQDGNVQNTDLVQEPHIKSEEKESPRVEITIENISSEENIKQESHVKGPTVDQQLIDQSKSTEMEQELHSVDSAPVRSRREKETGTAKQDGNVQTTHLVQEPHVKSEEKESPKVEITIENISSEENTKQESHVKGPTVDQQLTDQSKSTEMEQEELHSVDSATDPQYKEKHEETEVSIHDRDFYATNVKSESPVKSEDVEFFQIQEATAEKPSLREHTQVEYSVDQEILSLPQEEVNLNQEQTEHFNLSEVGEAHESTDALNEKDTEATTIQNTHPVVVTSEPVTHEAMDSSDIDSMKLTDQAEISDTYQLTITSTDESSVQQDVSSPENKDEHSIEHSNLETLDQKKEDYNTREPQIRDLGSRDTEVGHLYEVVDRLEVDLKPTTEEVVHVGMKDVPFEDVDRDASVPTMQTEMNAPLASQHQDMLDKPTDTDFHPIVSRRKLGSSRRNKGRHHVKDSAAESQNQKEEGVKEKIDDETGGATEITSSVEVVMQEKTAETVVEGMDTSEVITDEVKDDAPLVDISEFIHLNVQEETGTAKQDGNVQTTDLVQEPHIKSEEKESPRVEITIENISSEENIKQESHVKGPTVDQQLIDQSKSTEMEQEELHSVDSATDPQYKEKHEETEVSIHGGDFYATNVKSESPVKSEDVEFFQIQEATAEKSSLREHTQVEYSADQEILSLPQEEVNLNQEQTEHFNLSEVGEAHESTDALNEKDTEATKIQDTHPVVVTSEPVTHEAMDSSITYSLNLSDTDLSQVQKDEDQVEDDLKPATEEAIHHELKEVPSEAEERESSIQTEMNASIPSEHQDIFDSEGKRAPMSSRRKLGSSRRIKQRQHGKDSADSLEEEIKEDLRGNKDSPPSEVRDNSPLAGTSEINISSVQSIPPVDSQLAEQTNTRAMPHEDLHSLDSAPVRSRREEETGTAKQDGNVQTTDLIQEPHIKSEEKESPRVEITIENISSEENTKQESHVKGPIVDQQLTDQSKSTEMEQEGLHSVDSFTDPQYKEKHEETEVSIHDGDFYATNIKSESPVKSEEKESPKVEITIENISSEENTKQESNVNEAFVSLQKEVTTNEQQHRLLSISGLTVPHNLEDKVSEVDEEIKTTLQNTQSEMHIRLDPQPLEDPQNIHSEQTQTSVETIEDGGTKKLVEVREHYNAEAEGSMNVNVPGLQHGAPAVKETHALDEFAYTELFPVPRNETQAEARLDTFLEETARAEASTEESSMSEAVGECKGTPVVDQSENLQIKPQQKRRKMGSTRRAPMHRKQEEENETGAGNFHTDIGVRDHEKRNVLEAIPGTLVEKVNENEKPLQSETQKESDALEEERKTPSNAAIDLMAAIPLQVEPHGEAVVNPVMFANAASACDSEKNEGVIFNTSQPVDFASAEIHVPFVVAKNSSLSMNQLLPTDTENAGLASVYEMSLSTQNDDGLSESLRKKESEDSNELKALTSAESPAPEIVKEDAGEGDNNTLDNMREQNILHEGASNTSTETKNESPDLNLTKKRRKMGSTRKSLGTRPKREDLNEKQADDTEDAETTGNAGDVTTQSVCDVREKEPQLQTEHEDGDSGQGTGKGFETVDFSNIGDTCKTSAPQQLDDENPVSQRSLEESDQLISGDLSEIPAASSNLDAMLDSAAGRRRRKMGSHRSSRGAQTTKQGEITDTQNGSDARIVTDESAMKTAETRLDQIREVNDTNPFSISTSRTVSEKPSEPVTPAQHLYPDVQLDQERQRKLSLGYTRRANPSDIMYDVVMIGDSCVGKTSFMKRAQSGKFSLDLPASVGLDSCIWKVIVDGKPVVLHLWDTAGQERFRSLTRQTFYKAQAFLLMYDVSSVESFSAVNYWVNCIKEGAAEDVIVLLLGNKCDHTKRQVKIQQGESLAKEYNFDFMECSAATGENVIESLEIVARLLGQKAVPTEETLVLLQESKPKNKSGCC